MTLKERVVHLEETVATLRQQLEYAQTVAGIKRGLQQADKGLGVPARVWAEKVRRKHKLPRP